MSEKQEHFAPKDEPEVSVDEDDIAWMLYTSGTTGRPKGVMLSHKSQIADSANTILSCYPISRNDVHLSLLPMFHIGGMWHMRCHFYMGSTNVIMDTLDPKTVLETIEQERVSTTCIVPPMAVLVINCPDVDKYDVSSEVKLLNEEGEDCGVGEAGEILARGTI